MFGAGGRVQPTPGLHSVDYGRDGPAYDEPMNLVRALSAMGTVVALALAIFGPFRIIALAALAGAVVGFALRKLVPPKTP